MPPPWLLPSLSAGPGQGPSAVPPEHLGAGSAAPSKGYGSPAGRKGTGRKRDRDRDRDQDRDRDRASRPCRSGARGRRAVIPAPATNSGRAGSASPRQNSGKRSPGARGRRRREHGTRCLGAVPARDETRGSFGHVWFCPVTLRGYRIYLCY